LTDRFPEAFKRYEHGGSLKERGIKTFEELMLSFRNWGKDKSPLTRKQTRALGIEAKKIGIQPYQKIGFTRNNKLITAWRNVTNGQFVSVGEKKEKAPRLSDAEIARKASLRKAQKEAKTREYTRKLAEK